MVRGVRARSTGIDQSRCKSGHGRQGLFVLMRGIRSSIAIVYDSRVDWIGTRLVSA